MNIRLLAALAALVLMLFTAMAWGCTDTKDLEDRVDVVETQAASGAPQGGASDADMVTALLALSAAGLHSIDVDANDNNTVTAGVAGGVENALLAVAAVEWPSDLQSAATDLQDKLQGLLDALETEDAAVVGPPAHDAHEAQHEFEHMVGAQIREDTGLPTEAGGGEEEATPATAEPPAGTPTP